MFTALHDSIVSYPCPPRCPLDDPMGLCREILRAANGAPWQAIGGELVKLARGGERPRSWGGFVYAIRKRFAGEAIRIARDTLRPIVPSEAGLMRTG